MTAAQALRLKPCIAHGCEKQIRPTLLMCGRDWALVPRAIRERIWAEYHRGRDTDQHPTAEYLVSVADAVRAVDAKRIARA